MPSLLPKTTLVYGYDSGKQTPSEPIKLASFDKVAACNIIILAIPFSQYPSLLAKLAKRIRSDQLVIDVCSVKILPRQTINQFLPKHPNLLLTHPLFGPHSYKPGSKNENNKLILTYKRGELAEKVLAYCSNTLHLDVTPMTEQKHDKLMADIHAVTFFVARGLSRIHLQDQEFTTPSYKMIVDLVKFDQAHSDELFDTIQRGNPYAAKAHQEIVKSFSELNREINNGKVLEK